MDLADYERHILQQLCWICSVRTHRSNRAQRQCPRCRRKWSYRRRLTRIRLLRLFASGAVNPNVASTTLGVAYRTAWTHFLEFERVVRQSELADFSRFRNLRLRKRWPFSCSQYQQEKIAEFIFRKAGAFINPLQRSLSPRGPKGRTGARPNRPASYQKNSPPELNTRLCRVLLQRRIELRKP